MYPLTMSVGAIVDFESTQELEKPLHLQKDPKIIHKILKYVMLICHLVKANPFQSYLPTITSKLGMSNPMQSKNVKKTNDLVYSTL